MTAPKKVKARNLQIIGIADDGHDRLEVPEVSPERRQRFGGFLQRFMTGAVDPFQRGPKRQPQGPAQSPQLQLQPRGGRQRE